MCGIIAYKGYRNAVPIILGGLKRLEYRGYDSWGVVTLTNPLISVEKHVGAIGDVTTLNVKESTMGMGHTRWATHGRVTDMNAHPHLSCDRKIAVVHNGIIENFAELKKRLSEHAFLSETDTEVLPHLIEEYMKDMPFLSAVFSAIKSLEGRYAFTVMNKETGEIAAARKGSPLIVGIKQVGHKRHEYFVASDASAFLNHTNEVVFLEDNELAYINGNVQYFNSLTAEEVRKPVEKINWDAEQAEKGTFRHYMLKEIFEQSETIARVANPDPVRFKRIASLVSEAEKVFIIGCGTSGKVALASSYAFSKVAKKQVIPIIGSEFYKYQGFVDDRTVIITISQSGETADILEAVEHAKSKDATVISLVNVQGSSLTRLSDEVMYTKSGPEIAVASTKVTTAQFAVLLLLAYTIAGKLLEAKKLLRKTQDAVAQMLTDESVFYIQHVANKMKNMESVYVIGRGVNYATALEAAIKLQEVAYTHAEGFAGGELKHGPLALIKQDVPCIAVSANDETKNDLLSNAMEVKARQGYLVGIGPDENALYDYFIKVPDIPEASFILNLVPIQLLAYYLAVYRGNNPDKPRNLAKSVTVK